MLLARNLKMRIPSKKMNCFNAKAIKQKKKLDCSKIFVSNLKTFLFYLCSHLPRNSKKNSFLLRLAKWTRIK